jgi:hypothetical protein
MQAPAKMHAGALALAIAAGMALLAASLAAAQGADQNQLQTARLPQPVQRNEFPLQDMSAFKFSFPEEVRLLAASRKTCITDSRTFRLSRDCHTAKLAQLRQLLCFNSVAYIKRGLRAVSCAVHNLTGHGEALSLETAVHTSS